MNDHDAVSDDGDRVVCACGREWTGPKARDGHLMHWRIEQARAALKEGRA